MKWADFNGTHFKLVQQKTDKETWIKAPKKLLDLLAKRERVHDNILTHKWRKPYTRNYFGHQIKDVLIANGDGKYTTHGLRKNAGIILAENGATVPQIMAALGHTSPKLALTTAGWRNKSCLTNRRSRSWTRLSSAGTPSAKLRSLFAGRRSGGCANAWHPARRRSANRGTLFWFRALRIY